MAGMTAAWWCWVCVLHRALTLPFHTPEKLQGASFAAVRHKFLRVVQDDANASALVRLHQLKEVPLYGNVLDASHVPNASILERPVFEMKSGHPVTVVAYHKTGYEFSDQLLSLRSNLTGETYSKASHICSDERAAIWCTPAPAPPHSDLEMVVVPSSTDFTPPTNAPTIHFVRHPVDLILSAYRYHKQTPELWEKSPKCFMCSESDWHAIFGLCSDECSYFDLLQALPDVEGIFVEAVGMRGQTQTMLSNLRDWAPDPNVLHLSVAHLAADYDKTIRCVESFLGVRGLGRAHLPALDSLRVSSLDPHVTAGKFDNARLRKTLLDVSAWASDFARARQMLSDIFVRQGLQYDCPVP